MRKGSFLNLLRLPRILRVPPRVRPASSLAPRKRRVSMDVAPELAALWQDLWQSYFPEKIDLADYAVGWSRRRQRRTLACCEVRRKIVRVAKEMRDPLFAAYLPALLYHEMCHAALGEDVGYHRGKRAWHGPRFKSLESRHPGIPELDAWIKSGGWHYAVRRLRAVEQHQKQKRITKS